MCVQIVELCLYACQVELRKVREQLGWSIADLVEVLLSIDPAIRTDVHQVSRWERGERHPHPYSRALLCMALNVGPEALGFSATPKFLADIAAVRARLEAATHWHHLEPARLEAALAHRWPADDTLLDELEREVAALAELADLGPAEAALPGLERYSAAVWRLLGRDQPHRVRLLGLIAESTEAEGFLHRKKGNDWVGDRLLRAAESLARESGSPNRIAMMLAAQASAANWANRPRDTIRLAKAALDTMDNTVRPGLRTWAFAVLAVRTGDEKHLELAYRAAAGANVNLFCPNYNSAWLDGYHGLFLLRAGRRAEAARVYAEVLRKTHPRLLWERAAAEEGLRKASA